MSKEVIALKVSGALGGADEFAAHFDREVRTTLGLILGAAESLAAMGDLPPEARRDAHGLRSAARGLCEQLKALLKGAGDSAGLAEYAEVDLTQLVNLALAHFDGPARERQIAFVVEAPPVLPAQVDSYKLQRVLWDVLTHAVRGGAVGGSIRCMIGRQDRRVVIRFRYQCPGAGPPGLVVAREVMTSLMGSLAVSTDPNGEWRVHLELPQEAPAGVTVMPAADPAAWGPAADSGLPPEAQRPLVLVIEDNAVMNRFIASALKAKYRVESAFDGREGLEKALTLRPDLILSDVIMPGMSGDQFLRAVRERRELDGVPVILLSGKIDEEFRVQVLRAGAQDYLIKPFSVPELDARVANLITIKLTRDVLQRELASQHQDLVSLAADIARHRREQAFLAKASKALAVSFDAETISTTAAQQAIPILAEECVVFLRQDDGQLRRVAGATSQRCTGTGHGEPPARMSVPLASHGQTLGLMEFAASAGRYEENELALAEDFAARTALALDHARLYREQHEALSRKAEALEALRASNEKLNGLIQAAPFPILARDRDGNITIWNDAAQGVFGWTAAEVTGRLVPFVPEGKHDEAAEMMNRIWHGAAIVRFVTRRRRLDGSELDVSVCSAPLHDARGEVSGMISVYQDISNRIRFLQIAAHELRNPMAAVKGVLYFLRQRLAAGRSVEDLGHLLGVMDKEMDRLADLLNQILEAFRISEGHRTQQFAPIDLTGIVTAVLDVHRVAGGKHQFRAEGLDVGSTWVWGDGKQLTQVFTNLFSNAIKYSPAGGNVCVRLSKGKDEAVVSITDQGMGIPQDQLAQVFEPFFRARNLKGRDPGGMGLGLYICREIVQSHHGEIRVTSEDGGGATFQVSLPLHSPERMATGMQMRASGQDGRE